MNIISKKKQGVIAIICAIAMIVTSLTIYNPRETKADTDYSTLEFTSVTESMDSTYAYCITDNTLKDFSRLNFYGTYYMQVIGSGNSKMKEATVTIDGTVQTDTTIAFDRADAITGFNVSNLSNNAYHELKIEGEGGNITIILRKGNVNGETEESTELQKPAAPIGLVANINDLKTDYTIAFANVATATSYKFYLDGTYVKDINNGGVVTIEELKLEEGKTYTFGVSAVNAAGESDISTVEVKVPSKETETSTPSYTDGEVLVNESNVTKEVPAYEGGDYWQNEYNSFPVNYVAGKKYVAEVVVSSTAAKAIKLVFQRINICDFVDANSGYEATIAAGNKVKITYVFEATQSTDNGNFDIYLGSVADATTLVFESKKLTTYNEVPSGVQTGVEVLSTPKTYTVTVDGTPVSVTEGKTYTFGDNAQGYYDVTNSVAYASGEEITVNSDITVTSIKLNVAMQKGASVRLATPTGLRFQTVITSENDIAVSDILNKDFVTTGTLITTFDLFSANGNVLDKDSKYTKLDIANSGWYNDEVGKFCGSIIKIKTDNYEKKFVGVGYATITYHNGKTYPIYATVNEEDNARSIYYVANAVKQAGYKNCDDIQKTIIDKYLAKEAF